MDFCSSAPRPNRPTGKKKTLLWSAGSLVTSVSCCFLSCQNPSQTQIKHSKSNTSHNEAKTKVRFEVNKPTGRDKFHTTTTSAFLFFSLFCCFGFWGLKKNKTVDSKQMSGWGGCILFLAARCGSQQNAERLRVTAAQKVDEDSRRSDEVGGRRRRRWAAAAAAARDTSGRNRLLCPGFPSNTSCFVAFSRFPSESDL